MENLNKTFYERQTLTAAELNLIISKINEIIENIPSSSTQNPGITETEINNKINAAKNELQLKINQILSQIENLDDGNTHVRTDEEMMDLFKQAGKEVLVYYGVCDENGHPFFNTIIDENGVKPAAIIGAITDNNGKLNSSIGISADQVILDGDVTLTQGLTAMNGEITNLTSSNADIRNRLSAAEAAIGEGDGSEEFEKMKQDLENLSLVVNGKAAIEDLNALSATVGNKTNNSDFQDLVGNLNDLTLVVNGKAAIEDLRALKATVDDMEAGNVTITGDLHYNRAIGNVSEVSTSQTIDNNNYFVRFTGPTSADVINWPILSLTTDDVIQGQTIFLDCGTRCFKLAAPASGQLTYYYRQVEDSQNTVQYTTISNGELINVFDAGWTGVVQFIYTGSKWQQVTHNISLY